MTNLEHIESTIAELSTEVQIRINTIADMLRAMECQDDNSETELAMLLVLEEINGDCEASAHIGEVIQ